MAKEIPPTLGLMSNILFAAPFPPSNFLTDLAANEGQKWEGGSTGRHE